MMNGGYQMKIMKYVPNALSIARIVLDFALLLLASRELRWVFAAVYLFIGLTDVLDGWIARRYHVESKLGSKLDAWGDSLLFGTALISILFIAKLKVNPFTAAICLLTMVPAILYKLANVVVTHKRFGEWNMMHTLANKFVFVTLYLCVPVFMLLWQINYWVILGITVAILFACLEETVTLVKLSEYDVNHHGLVGQKIWKNPEPASKA